MLFEDQNKVVINLLDEDYGFLYVDENTHTLKLKTYGENLELNIFDNYELIKENITINCLKNKNLSDKCYTISLTENFPNINSIILTV